MENTRLETTGVKHIKQLDFFESESSNDIVKETIKDISESFIFFGEGGQRLKDLNRTSEFIKSIPKGRYTIFKTGGQHRLPEFKGRNDFPYVLNNYNGLIVKASFSRSVYPSYTLSNKDKYVRIYCHRLFAMCFIKNKYPNKTYTVDHINEDKLDYAVSNLTWVTASANQKNIQNRAANKETKYKVYSEKYI